jgi:hypothetical protein
LYSEFTGKLTPDVDVAGIRRATEEYITARNARERQRDDSDSKILVCGSRTSR